MDGGMSNVGQPATTVSMRSGSCDAKHEGSAGKFASRWRKLRNTDKQKGVSLTELMVALGIFLLFSSVFTASVMQYLRSTNSTAVRAQSASTVMMATQRLERFVTYSNSIGYATTGGSSGSADKNTVLIYSAPSSGNDSGAASASVGQYSGSKLVTSNTQVTFSSRNFAAPSATGSASITYAACQ